MLLRKLKPYIITAICLALLAAFGIPVVLNSRDSGHGHQTAVRVLKHYISAQNLYRRRTGAFATSIEQLEKLELMEPTICSAFQGAQRAAVAYRGWFFSIIDVDPREEDAERVKFLFAGSGWPESYGSSGLLSFYIDHAGIIYWKDNQGKPVTALLGSDQLTSDGWLHIQ